MNYLILVAVAAVILLFIRRTVMFNAIRKKLPEHLKAGAVVVDVRSPEEYRGGHMKGSLNIPVQELANRTKELDPNKTVLLCCASGARSSMAEAILKAKGFKNVVNAGPWTNLKG